MDYFCIIKEKIAYMEYVIQRSMFYSFYLFLSILLYNVNSALVSDPNAYSNEYLNFELHSNVRITFKYSNLYSNVEGMCFWKMASSNDVGKKIS